MNKETATLMETHRCGVPDVDGGGAFVLRGCNYNILTLTYRFENVTAEQRQAMLGIMVITPPSTV